jgi:hypothetical protein
MRAAYPANLLLLYYHYIILQNTKCEKIITLLNLKLSHYTPRGCLGGRYSSYSFSTSALDGGGRSASRPGPHFSPGEKTPGTHCTGGWVGPRAGLDTEARGKILSPLPGIDPRSPGRPARSQTLYWLRYAAHLTLLLQFPSQNFDLSIQSLTRNRRTNVRVPEIYSATRPTRELQNWIKSTF